MWLQESPRNYPAFCSILLKAPSVQREHLKKHLGALRSGIRGYLIILLVKAAFSLEQAVAASWQPYAFKALSPAWLDSENPIIQTTETSMRFASLAMPSL